MTNAEIKEMWDKAILAFEEFGKALTELKRRLRQGGQNVADLPGINE